MDANLQELLRAVEAAPSDAEAARRYDAALRRSGRGAEVDARLLDKYLCPERWDRLHPSRPGSLPAYTFRHCDRCAADVPLCSGWEGDPAISDVVAAGGPFAFTASSAAVQATLRALRETETLHTAAEERPGRGHLCLSYGLSYGDAILRRAEELGPLLERHGVWVLPLGFRGFGSRTAALAAEVSEAIEDYLPLARRLTPLGREPYFVLEASLRHLRPPPATPARHVLGWVGLGEGGAVFMTRAGALETPDEAVVSQILAERANPIGLDPR